MRITRIPILPFGIVNAHLVRGAGGAILVDAGLPGLGHSMKAAPRRGELGFRGYTQVTVLEASTD